MRHNFFAILILLSVILFPFSVHSKKPCPVAHNGIIDLTEWNFKTDGPVELSGEWKFKWLKDNEDYKLKSYDDSKWDNLHVPSFWKRKTGTSFGYAWLRLKIILPDQAISERNESLGIFQKYFFSSYDMYIDGTRFMTNGVSGHNRASSVPQQLPVLKHLDIEKKLKTLDIAIKTSNYHRSRGGPWASPILGQYSDLQLSRTRILFYVTVICGILLMMSVYHILLWLGRKEESASLYFSFLCLTIIIYIVINYDIMEILFPSFNLFELRLKLDYIHIPLMSCFAGCTYFSKMFPEESFNRVLKVLYVAGLCHIIFGLLTPSWVYSPFFWVNELTAVAALSYMLTVTLLAIKQNRKGAKLILCGFIFVSLAALNDILFYRHIVSTGRYLPVGLVILIFSQSSVMSARFTSTFRMKEILNKELKKSLKKVQTQSGQIKIFKRFTESSSQGLCIANLDGTIVYCNPSLGKMLDISQEDATIRNLREFYSEENILKLRNSYLPEVIQKGNKTFEISFRRQGKEIPTTQSVFTLYNEDRSPQYFATIVTDITKQKKVERELSEYRDHLEELVLERTKELSETNMELKESEKKITALFETAEIANIGIAVIQDEGENKGVIKYINQAILNMMGFFHKEAHNRNMINFFHPDSHEKLYNDYMLRVVENKAPNQREYYGLKKDGQKIPVEISTGNTEYNGKPALVAYITDISERKIVEANLAEANRQLVDSAHQAGMADISSGTLHNVGNILNSVKTSAEIIKDASKNSSLSGFKKANHLLRENMENLTDFISSDSRGIKLFQYYLKLEDEFAKENSHLHYHSNRLSDKVCAIEDVIIAQQRYAGTASFSKDHSLPEIIEDALTIQAEVLEKYHIKILKNYDYINKVLIQKTKVIHIIINLIQNARDAMSETPSINRKLELSVYRKDSFVFLTVKDTGTGILQENMNNIFTYGFTTKKEGHGFGLHSCANYMTEMGGEISVESNDKEEGTTVVLKFPV